MARIIETHLTPVVNLVISTIYTNGNVSNDVFKEEDIIQNMRYVLNNDIATISGRLAKINYTKKTTKRNYTTIQTAKSYFSEDVVPSSITIDCSEQYKSKVVNVPVNEILEFTPDGDEVERVSIGLKYGVHFDVELSNESVNSFNLNEGSIYQEFTYLDLTSGTDKTVEAKVIAITSNSVLSPTSVVFMENGSLKEIDIMLVKNVANEIVATDINATAVNEAILTSATGIVNLSLGEITNDISISKDVEIIGAYPDVKVNSVSYKGKDTGTIISGKIDVTENVSLTMKGITLTNDAYLNLVSNASNVTLENCIIKDVTPYQNRSYLCLTKGENTPIKLIVKGCYFGSNVTTDDSAYYNAFELVQKLADGSEISDNYFEEKVCSNNIICIYDVEENANIYIRNNVFEYSSNAIRVGTKGDAKCNIFVENNVYYKTSTTPEYAGLLLVQPYGVATTNMSNVNITLSGNKHNDKLQLYYLYAGTKDMQFTDTNKPNITVN